MPGAQAKARDRVVLWVSLVLVVAGVALIAIRQRHRGTPTAQPSQRVPGAPAHTGPQLPGAGSPSLTGFVVDGVGAPVSGADVSAELESSVPQPAPATSDAGVPADAGAGATHATPTGADGRFGIAGLAPGRYRIRVTGAGLVPAELRFVPVPSDEARIVVAREVAIAGTVTDGGKPAPNAQVALRGDAIGGTIEQKASATGTFEFPNLPEGRYQLYAYQGATAARTIRVNRLGAGPFGPVELRLEAATIVVGHVIDREDGSGMAAAIELRPIGDDQAPRYARAGEDGVFRIEGVPNGEWIADAFAPGYLSPGGVELEAGNGVPELALTRGAAIEGHVYDGDGRPLANATVRVLTSGQNPTEISAEVDHDKLLRFSGRSAASAPVSPNFGNDPGLIPRGELGVMVGPIPPIPPPGAQVAQPTAALASVLLGEPPPIAVDPARASIWTTGSDGAYRIRGIPKAKVTVLATAPGYAEARSQTITIEPPQVIAKIDLVMTPGTLIVGKVTDQHGFAVVGAQITATPELGLPLYAFTDDQGEYKLGPVTGKLELHASAYGHGEAKKQLELAAVRGSTPATRREDIVLAIADAIVAGTLDDTTGAPVSGAQIEVVGGAADGRRATVAADGTFSIDMLPAGTLRIRIQHPEYPTEEQDVTAASRDAARLRLRLAIGGGAEGVLLDVGGGALASVTIEASGPGGTTMETSTDKTGKWKLSPLKPGTWKLSVKQAGYLPLARSIEVAAARVPGGITVRDVRLELVLGALVGGTVRDSRGHRVTGAHVVVHGDGGTCEADTDAQGEFRIHDCPTGDIAVTATIGDASASTRTTVRPGTEVLSLSIDLP